MISRMQPHQRPGRSATSRRSPTTPPSSPTHRCRSTGPAPTHIADDHDMRHVPISDVSQCNGNMHFGARYGRSAPCRCPDQGRARGSARRARRLRASRASVAPGVLAVETDRGGAAADARRDLDESKASSWARCVSPRRPRRCGRTVLVVDASVMAVALIDDGRDGEAAAVVRGRGSCCAGIWISKSSRTAPVCRSRDGAAGRGERSGYRPLPRPIARSSRRALGARCWELRGNLTPVYDAAYVALGGVLDAPAGHRRYSRLAEPPPAHVRCEVDVLSLLTRSAESKQARRARPLVDRPGRVSTPTPRSRLTFRHGSVVVDVLRQEARDP